MASIKFNFNFGDVRKFADKMQRASNADIRRDAALWLEAAGTELLRIVEDEIIRRQVVDTRLLLHSFSKGSEGNVWRITNGGLTLEAGTHVHYARYVNDGHWTNPKGVSQRFVPGVWHGEKFEYVPGAKTGMLLKQKWIDAQPYWDSALYIFGKMFPELIGAGYRQWIRQYLK